MLKQAELKFIAVEGCKLLEDAMQYKNTDMILKLKYLGLEVSPSSFSNCINKKEVGKETLKKIGTGIAQIVQSELGLVYNPETRAFESIGNNWEKKIIPTDVTASEDKTPATTATYIFHQEGRLKIEDKVRFMQKARLEVIEVGVRLRTFSEYFTSRKESEFRRPVEELLQKGIDIKIYILDPESEESKIYFEDRAKIDKKESQSMEVTKNAIAQIKEIIESFREKKYPGSFEIFTYRHIPYNHFLAIDAIHEQGQMMVSHYIYGIRRADCPVLEFSKTANPDLYHRYWFSLQEFTKNAVKIL